MPESDWSQFVPDLIITIIGVLLTVIVTGTIAYFKIERFKAWLNKLLSKFALGVKWLFGKWHFFLPLCIVIISEAIIFRIYRDWKIAALSIMFYMMGLLGWGLSDGRQIFHSKIKAINSIKTKFLPISLSAGIGNSYLKNRYIDPPIGDVVLGGAQFQLKQDSLNFDTNEHIRYHLPLEDGCRQIDFQLPKPVNGIKAVYFLINSGNSKIIYANKSTGKIRLVFKDAPPIDVDLVLGQNIREWCPGNSGDYIRETSSPETVTGVWTGMSKNGANAVIDCLKIPVFEFMKDCYLEKIIFIHKSFPQPPDKMGVHYSVFGVSIEIQQPPELNEHASNNSKLHTKTFVPSDLDVEIMKKLAAKKEAGLYWVEASAISAVLGLTQNQADYFLRNLEKYGFVHHHKLDGKWGIKDMGIDYLIERKYI